MALKYYTSVEKSLKLKVRMSRGLTPAFVKDTGEKMLGGASRVGQRLC